ncbi:MAG: hypothetical protein HQK51_11650 [Oligoflexia bacterium]|nr:hypothetical protein [Oligoflexia bacterium]
MKTLLKITQGMITIALILSLAFFVSCKNGDGTVKPQIIKDVKLTTSLVDGDVWLGVGATFDLGAMSFTSIKLPIIDPYDKTRVYGEINFAPTFSGNYNAIEIKVNLSDCAKIPGSSATLPNGNALPMSGLDGRVVALDIDQIHSKIYLALDHNLTLLGFAISIKEFDVVAQYVGGANIFLGFSIPGVNGSDYIKGNVGLYTSLNTSYESGLAFFVDISSVMSTDILNDIIDGVAVTEEKFLAKSAKTWSKAYKQNVTKQLGDKLPSVAKQKRFSTIVNKMMNTKQTLNFVEE